LELGRRPCHWRWQLQPRPSPRGCAVAVCCTSSAAGSAVIKQSSAPWYRALMRPIAPSVGRTTTRRPGSILAMMVSGILAQDSHPIAGGSDVLPARFVSAMQKSYVRRAKKMNLLNIVTSPRKEKSASTTIVNAFLSEFREHVRDVTIDSLDIWQERLPEFDAEAINAKYKGVSGESMTPVETATWEKIRELASRFQRADRIVLGVPMWNFSVPYKLKQLIDLTCQRNMLFTFDGEFYGPSLNIDKAFVAYVRGQSDEAGFKTVSQPGFEYLSGYVEFWLRFIGVRSVVTLAVEHTWDGLAVDMIDAGKRQAVELARQF
jgi:FMN-dependent NADH-azoreductase